VFTVYPIELGAVPDQSVRNTQGNIRAGFGPGWMLQPYDCIGGALWWFRGRDLRSSQWAGKWRAVHGWPLRAQLATRRRPGFSWNV